MSLRIICGRGGSGKSTYMLNNMPENKDVLYIVPEQFSFSAEKMIIDKFGIVGLGMPQVLSFMRLADTVFSKYGSPEFMADTASFEMLVSYCANSIKPDDLWLFNGLVKKSELAATASNIITTFKRYRITPDQIKYAIANAEDELLKKKLTDSLAVFEAYTEELALSGVADHNDKLHVLSNILSDEDCDYLCGKHIYIDQFADFDPSEYECIKQMLKRAENVTVALCTDGSEEFSTINTTYNKLLQYAKEENIIVEPTIKLNTAMIGAAPMIKHLEESYFNDKVMQFAGNDGSISVFCGKNRFSEIHNVARQIVHLVRQSKMRFRDISIVARDVEIYKGIIDRVFPFYDIPVFLDRKMPLSGHCISMFIMSTLDIAISGFSYENIFSHIKSPFSPLTIEEADELENYCLATGIRPYAWNKPFSPERKIYCNNPDDVNAYYSSEKIDEINKLREKVYLPLSKLIKSLKKDSTVRELCAYLFEYFEETKLELKVKQHAQKLEDLDENLYALQTVQVYNILIELFNDICAVLGHKKLTLHEFYTTVQAGLCSVEIGTIPISSDCVTVGSIDRIKGHGAKVVFLIGANSGVFPCYPTENGLFSDDDKKAMEKLGIEMPPCLLQLTQNEQLLIYDALTCASNKLYLSYASADNESKAMFPSEIVERVTSIFPDIEFKDDVLSLTHDENIITTKKAVFDMLCSDLRNYSASKKPLSPMMSAAAYYFSKDEVYAPLLKQATDMTGFTNAVSRIKPWLIDELIGEDMKTSISRLEAYNKCPFSFFAKYVLRLKPKQTFEVNVSDSGSFLHDFLDKFSQFISISFDENGNKLTWKTIDNDFIRIHTPDILKEVLSGVNSRMFEIPRIKHLFERLCRTAEQSAYAVKRHISKSDFIPIGYEISFDENGNFKPRKIKLPDGKTIILRGRIDRADEFNVKLSDGTEGKFVRIVDYKSGEKELSLSEVYHGVQLQLFVYLSTLCDNGFSPAGILYCNLSDPVVNVNPNATEEDIEKKRFESRRLNGIVLSEHEMFEHMGGKEILKSGKTLTAKNFNQMFRHINKVIKNTAEKIYNGNFPIKCTDDACKWCDYSQLCRFDSSFSGCSINSVAKINEEEIWNLLDKEESDNEMDR